MQKFISCDWGTSTFRLRLIEADTKTVLAEVINHQGISETYKLWKQRGYDEENRLSFYQSIIQKQISVLDQQAKDRLQDVPVIVSGMASSTMGMIELPYKHLPFHTNGNDLEIETINATDDFQHTLILISGVRTSNDVMRGEEIQLIGCEVGMNDHIFIFPGTHSKHVFTEQCTAVDFNTYMTGEFFNILSTQSILSTTILEAPNSLNAPYLNSFEEGVVDSVQSNLLHSSFLVRTNYLLGKRTKEENYYYLSGLLLGTELKELQNVKREFTIVSNAWIGELYMIALKKLGVVKVVTQNSDHALINGQCKVFQAYLLDNFHSDLD